MSTKTAAQLLKHVSGMWSSWIVVTAVKLDIADHLAKRPLSIADLSKATNTHQDSLLRLMRSLSSLGIFKQDNDGNWCLTPVAELLTTTSSKSLKYHFLAFVQDSHLALAEMDQAVRTGKPVFDDVFGVPYYEYLKSHKDKFNNLKQTLKGYTEIFCSNIPDIYDFKRFNHIVDCGGNDGSFLIHILKSAVNSRGTVFDEPSVIEDARSNVAKSEVKDRFHFVAGNILESVPPGGDCYVLKLILLDWPDDRASKIISNVAKQMNTGNRLLIIQSFIPESDEPHIGKIMDPVLLCLLSGKERTKRQVETMVRKAGLRVKRFIQTDYEMFEILEAAA